MDNKDCPGSELWPGSIMNAGPKCAGPHLPLHHGTGGTVKYVLHVGKGGV